MKRFVMLVVSAILVVGLTGCFNYNNIEKNFEEIGYEFSSNASNISAIYKAEFTEDGIEVDSFVFSDGEGSVAIIFDFEEEDDIETAFKNNTLLIGLIDDGYTQEELTRKHYVVAPLSSSSAEREAIIDAFQD